MECNRISQLSWAYKASGKLEESVQSAEMSSIILTSRTVVTLTVCFGRIVCDSCDQIVGLYGSLCVLLSFALSLCWLCKSAMNFEKKNWKKVNRMRIFMKYKKAIPQPMMCFLLCVSSQPAETFSDNNTSSAQPSHLTSKYSQTVASPQKHKCWTLSSVSDLTLKLLMQQQTTFCNNISYQCVQPEGQRGTQRSVQLYHLLQKLLMPPCSQLKTCQNIKCVKSKCNL